MSSNKDKSINAGTEYKLSVSSNPGSRRSSLGGVGSDIYLGSNASMGNISRTSNNDPDNEFNLLHKYLVPQISDLHDSVITLEGNFERLNNIHNNLVDLNESFGSLLYGIICTSSCLQFPDFPNNTSEQINIIDKLRQLDQEKQTLLKEISDIKTSNRHKNKPVDGHTVKTNPNNSKGKFSQPLFPANQAKRLRPTAPTNRDRINIVRNQSSNNHISTTHADHHLEKNDINVDNDDDDNSSEASFVMNPTNIEHEFMDDSSGNNVDRRYRRKSILNVIRNSISPEDYQSNNRGYQPTNRSQTTANRYSLGGRARRVTHASSLMSAPSTNNQHQLSSSVSRLSRSKPTKKAMSTAKRPPFR